MRMAFRRYERADVSLNSMTCQIVCHNIHNDIRVLALNLLIAYCRCFRQFRCLTYYFGLSVDFQLSFRNVRLHCYLMNSMFVLQLPVSGKTKKIIRKKMKTFRFGKFCECFMYDRNVLNAIFGVTYSQGCCVWWPRVYK